MHICAQASTLHATECMRRAPREHVDAHTHAWRGCIANILIAELQRIARMQTWRRPATAEMTKADNAYPRTTPWMGSPGVTNAAQATAARNEHKYTLHGWPIRNVCFFHADAYLLTSRCMA